MADLGSDLTPKVIAAGQKECKELLEKHYYQAWDCGVGDMRLETKRNYVNGQDEKHSKLFFLYRDQADVKWNGNILTGKVDQLVQQLFQVKTKHTLKTLDVQPILDEFHFLCSVTGQCRYDDEVTRAFSQTFIVWKDKSPNDPNARPTFWIIHDNFRWIKADEL